MNTPTRHETVIRQRFITRLNEWWQAEAPDPEVVAAAADELMTDLGYTIKKPSLRKVDPVAYRMLQREYMREYQRGRRAKMKADTNV